MSETVRGDIKFKVFKGQDSISSDMMWDVLSFYTNASDTKFDPIDVEGITDANNNVQYRLGEITGITSDINTVSRYKCVSSNLINNIMGESNYITLDRGQWDLDNTINLYKQIIRSENIEEIVLNSPIIYLIPLGGDLPTEAEKDVWGELEMVANTSNSTLTFYVETLPTINVKVGIKGVVMKNP